MTSWPQPHEGITGTDRPGWLLSLDEEAVPFRNAIIALARHLQSAVLVGNPAPVVRRMNDRMRHPEIGDLVVTNMALMTRDLDTRLKGLGVLLSPGYPGRREWFETDKEWAAFCAREAAASTDPETLALIISDENRTTDTAFYVQYGPDAGDRCRWVNDTCMMVPAGIGSFSIDAAAERTGTSAMFTRDSLVAGLADSGFRLRLPGPRDEDDHD